MTESEILKRIKAMNGSRDCALLASFWLLMGGRYDIRLFTLNDLRDLTGDSRAIFYAISEAYASQQLTILTPGLASVLMDILVGYEHEQAQHIQDSLQVGANH
jgi:hypothetical protein